MFLSSYIKCTLNSHFPKIKEKGVTEFYRIFKLTLILFTKSDKKAEFTNFFESRKNYFKL